MNDPVSDLIIRIKNAVMRKKESVDMPSSFFKEEISRVLFEEGFISKYETLVRGSNKILRITLKYGLNKFGKMDDPLIKNIKQVSTPGRKVYAKRTKLPIVQSGFGIAIVSTPKGVMASDLARRKKLGGEVIAYVY